MPETWMPGDVAYYVLPKSAANRRDRDLYLAITVVKVTPTRVIVRPRQRPRDGRGGHRIIKAHSLVKVAPQGAWVR